MEPFIGEIRLFAFNRIPTGWLPCDGRILPAGNNQALYALLGNQFGGSAPSSFGLPDLRGRVPVQFGTKGPVGSKAGLETVTLSNNEMPMHNHMVKAVSSPANALPATGGYPAVVTLDTATEAPAPNGYAPYAQGQAQALDPTTLTGAGGNSAHENRQPSLAMNYCIATTGLWPPHQ